MQIATPYSALFDDETDKQEILAHSDAIELRSSWQTVEKSRQLFHCELSLVSQWSDSERKDLEQVAKEKELELFSLHVLSRYRDNEIVGGIFAGNGEPYSRQELLKNAQENSKFLHDLFYPLPILVENNNHLGSDAYEIVTDPKFISELVERFDLFFLWDIAHALITANNCAIKVNDYIASLPMDRCLQIHLSHFEVHEGIAFDSHELLDEEDWAFFLAWLKTAAMSRFVSIEYYKDKDILIEQLKKLRECILRGTM